jgi:Protein of unknown function (DUF2924)
MKAIPSDVKNVDLTNLSATELEGLWRLHFNECVPVQLPKSLLSRLLAYRLRVQQTGGLSKIMSRFLDQAAIDLEAGREQSLPYPAEQRLKPGVVIVRERTRLSPLSNGSPPMSQTDFGKILWRA